MYHSADQARMRLTGCIVKLEGKWVIVRNVEDNGDGAINIFTHPVGERPDEVERLLKTTLTDKVNLDPRSPKLGYVATQLGWQYMYRVPQRRWKQGIHPDNVRCRDRRLVAYAFRDKKILKCLDNAYDSLEKVIAKGGGAFHRYFALSDGKLWYRGSRVGYLQGSKLVLDDKYHYLKEQLEKATS